jgi:tetratricopeptide (TPR) repeat protein
MRCWLLTIGFAFASMSAQADDRSICHSTNTRQYEDKTYYAVGLAACDRVIRDGSVTATQRQAAYRQSADWKRRTGDTSGALADFRQALRLNPRDHEAYDYRADLFVAMGEDRKALADYNKATELNPGYVAAYVGRGRIYLRRGDRMLAGAEFKKALSLPAQDRIDSWAHDEARTELGKL